MQRIGKLSFRLEYFVILLIVVGLFIFSANILITEISNPKLLYKSIAMIVFLSSGAVLSVIFEAIEMCEKILLIENHNFTKMPNMPFTTNPFYIKDKEIYQFVIINDDVYSVPVKKSIEDLQKTIKQVKV